jgi:hypothetical protein
LLKRKYRFWVQYGPDDDWGQRKESEDIKGAIDLLEQVIGVLVNCGLLTSSVIGW